MEPALVTDELQAFWPPEMEPATVMYGPPHSGPEGCEQVMTVQTVTDQGLVVRVPWSVTAEDIAKLRDGAVIWLSTWGGLPAHMLEVGGPPA